MNTHTIVCDLCPQCAPEATALANGFTRLNLQGEGPAKFKQLLGGDCPAHIDLCPECFAAFLAWATAHRASHQPKPEPVVVPAPVVEPPHEEHVEAAHVEPHAETPVEQDPHPAAHEETHA